MVLKKVLIFGATGGLGIELSLKFLKNNYLVMGTSTSSKKIQDIKKKFKKLKLRNMLWKNCDFRSESKIRNTLKYFFRKEGHIDNIIICPGFPRYDGVNKINFKNLENDFKINVFANIIINSEIMKLKRKDKKTLVVNIGSSSSYQGFKNTISYCSSKHALLGAIQSINSECISKNLYNTCVSMGSMKTPMGKKVRGQKYEFFIDPNKISEYIFFISNLKIGAYIEDVFFKRSKM
ncbi:SDR family oxidoreductase [Candidatus Pelagibacter sp. HIMB123]|uniref:SDR family oxidoreductase n=1 Tax=Candidatus Pelagibacter sp. HIMB123 TaxID=3415413 RepID=UPI003F82D50E